MPKSPETLSSVPFRVPPLVGASSHEVLVTLRPGVQLPERVPHHLQVAMGVRSPLKGFGMTPLDTAMAHIGAEVESVARAFLPREAVVNRTTPKALGLMPIGESYNAKEDALGLSRTFRVRWAGDVELEAVRAALEQLPRVERVSLNHIARTQMMPTDDLFAYQWGPVAVRADEAWDLETGHPELVIAVVDTGVDAHHESLCDKIDPRGHDFVHVTGPHGDFEPLGDVESPDDDPDDEDGHGTHCIGTAAGEQNGKGTVGMCWGGKVLAVRVMFRAQFTDGSIHSIGTAADIDAGIKFAVDSGAHVINLSLGTEAEAHAQVLQYALDHGVVVCAATGNENTTEPRWPAAWSDRCLAVGAIDSERVRASFSNYGASYGPFVVAPGVGIASTTPGNNYQNRSGTSMATPFASGVAALVQSVALRAGKRFAVEIGRAHV